MKLQAIIRAVCVIIDAFHFDLPTPAAASEPSNGAAAPVIPREEGNLATADGDSNVAVDTVNQVRIEASGSWVCLCLDAQNLSMKELGSCALYPS